MKNSFIATLRFGVIVIAFNCFAIDFSISMRYNYITNEKGHKKVIGMYFAYGETELAYLRQKDKRLCEVIDCIGHIDRTVDTDLFSSVIHHIIGQSVSLGGVRRGHPGNERF